MNMPDTIVFVVLLAVVAVALVLGLVALALHTRSADYRARQAESSSVAIGLSLGLLFGAILGTIVWISTDEFVFWVIFMGAGMTLGLALGSARATGRQ
jgi:hypothetical protein